ncbi:MAG: AAA domain-containing protein [Deltaproteobacteria bacterium]|nr:AAA domain-containing protein [Deltaproteobacteria bacterium]
MVSENEFYRKATLQMFSSLIAETALKRLKDYIKKYIPVEGMAFGLYEPETNSGRFLASIFPKDMKKPEKPIVLPDDLNMWMSNKWENEANIKIINDVDEEDPEIKKISYLFLQENCSQLNMDIELEGKRLGVFIIFTREKNKYTEEHAHLISLLHAPFTAAIGNMLRHEKITKLQAMLEDDNKYLNRRLIEISGDTLIGADFGLSNVMKMVRQVSPMNSPVLLMGETGTGKEVIANAIHKASERKDKPLIKVNCGAIPEGLIDSELFGHEKGAFTGAVSKKRGRFERAHTGTIFLDEVGELPLAAQVRLLRVLQEKTIERVGGTKTIPVHVRIISATHRPLEEMIKEGSFREDLWFRLNVFPIMIPPLRQRPEDIPEMVRYFMNKKSRELKVQKNMDLSQNIINELQQHLWPGNVRELENLVERYLITGRMEVLTGHEDENRSSLNAIIDTDSDTTVYSTLDHSIKSHIKKVLKKTGYRIEGEKGASRILDINPSTLRSKMRKLNIDYKRKS